jgi:predicted nucleic acid-binding protein
VLAEAHHLMRGVHDGGRRLNELVESGRLDLSFRYHEHIVRVHELIAKYASVPMSFADACLMTLSESLHEPCVFTVDADFKIYRRKRNRVLDILHPVRRG